ncbi:hypothetical protein [Ruegeria arenilitoris]|uniref:hypothetical protein n=1 Tax=Ruegeria arenilitoris TaxID=1173585 RepID=UPI0020C514B3|nr:hypothetical protein [Ruegeria arenilitoris]
MSSDVHRMRGAFFTTLLIVMLGTPVWGGAWLREKGSVFSAASVTGFKEADNIFHYKTSLYAEWGAFPKLTIGLDAEEHQYLYGHALIFARFPIADFGSTGRLAGEIGVGVHHRQFQSWALYKTTLSYGKNIKTKFGNGWVAVDTALEFRTHEALIHKLDFTAGLSSKRRLNPLFQIETSYTSNQPIFWSARPSVIYRPRTGKTKWIIGIERNSYQDSTGFKISLWNTR